jgi:NADPH-dependent 2,4-dienoyl-CoA reductase/sulfur reductase-like enzyme
VVATGLAARRLPGQPEHVPTLRTLDDARALRATLERARSLLVVGGGFIGAEVASAAVARGLAVTVVEAMPVPFAHALGAAVGPLCGRLVSEAGVDLRVGARIARFLDAPGTAAVELADGTRLEADAAVVGVGAVPGLRWLADSGVDVSDGLACDAGGRVHGAGGWPAGVWAVGDVAAWDDPVHGRRRREHWTGAGEQAAVVARAIVDAPPLPPSVPYFWSDQFGVKVQLVGWPERADGVLPLHGDGLRGGAVPGTVVGYLAGERLAAVAGFGAARLLARYRPLIASGATSMEALEAAGR